MKIKQRYILIPGVISSLVLIVGVFIWFSTQTTPEIKKVYKTIPLQSTASVRENAAESGDSQSPASVRENAAPLEADVAESGDSQSSTSVRENLISDLKVIFKDDKRVDRFIAFLESKEGIAFFSRNPTLEELNEKRRSLVPQSPLTREEMKAEWYADILPSDKTMEEIEQDIVDSISTLIREKGFQFEDPHDTNIITEVVLDSFKNRQLSPFMSKKFNENSREKFQWHLNTVKEQLIAAHQKAMNSPAIEATSSEPTYPSGPTDMSEAERYFSGNEIDFMATQETVETGDISESPAETMRKNFEFGYPEGPGDLSHLSIDSQVFVTLQKMNLPRERWTSALQIVIKHGPEEALPILKEFDPEIAQEIAPLIQMERERSGKIESVLQRRLEEHR